MTHCEMILDYMERIGGITQAEAARVIGCYRLGARIYDLRRRGVDIVKTMESDVNRFGATVRYARYTFRKAG